MFVVLRGFSVFAVLFLALTARADDPEPRKSDDTPGAVELSRSRVYVHVYKSTRLGHEHGVVGRLKSGRLLLDRDDDAGEIVFDITTFTADTDEARRAIGLAGSSDADTRRQVTQNMLGPDVLDARRYPTAIFTVKSAKPTGKNDRGGHPIYELIGEFTLHGVRRPIRVNATSEPQRDGKLLVRGAMSIRQTQFGITPFSKDFGAIGVADQLTIHAAFLVAPPDERDVP